MRIAVIGAGVSGLAAAYRLGRRHDVALFESTDRLGGHAHTVDVEVGGGRVGVDVGFMVFNERTYPNFVALLRELGVKSRPTSMGFSVSCPRTDFEYSGASLNGLFAKRSLLFRPSFHRMWRDVLRFHRRAKRLLATPGGLSEEQTVAEFVAQERFSSGFVDRYLFPMGSAIWSCPMGKFAEFPVRFVAEFFHNHGLLDLRDRPTWRVIEGGSKAYVQAILNRFRGEVRLNSPIRQVRRRPDGVETTAAGRAPERFDHVVFACHADQALAILADPSPAERELLSAFPYERSAAVLHTDLAQMPRRRRAWASWNYRLPAHPSAPASVTYCLNILQHIRSTRVVQLTLNPQDRIDPACVLARFDFEHPVFTVRRSEAQARRREMLNVRRTSYCGAYWRNGFHEDGVVSAWEACGNLEEADVRSFQDAPPAVAALGGGRNA